ncbi:putative DNA-binding transcriptional regulator YafY [Mucilaginibacter oryzae]|uniref:Putative DNA-binding transcriptional regulator YafY n=1 Tax=Mucilaginibacter oryzae TaxID=468058 RepID=A0A316HY46_9SPHI|nr:YafY family protein [Mucilaginibacter oryzae]PWK79962.1 putative DNA-binding transcriptional regulator YafY [Mucilaginibacter oryzae]
MNRIDRISAILIQLQSRRVVKAGDIADRFNISLRTVYRDIKTLEEAGIPLIGEAGVGYSIMEGYRLPPVMFTREEATAFLTAGKFVEKLTDTSTMAQYQSAMYKVRAVLKSHEKDALENLDDSIEVLKSNSQKRADNNDHIQTILDCIIGKKVMCIDYFAAHSQQDSKRDVEPIGVFYLDSFWHLIGYCRLRGGYRDFRIDRIKKLVVTDKSYVNSKHPTLKDYIDKTACEKHLEQVVIKVDKEIHNYLDHQKYYSGFVSEKTVGNKIEMTFLTISIEMFARWYMMFADHSEIVKPDILLQRIREITAGITKKIK